jgi:hypothetical protein
MQSVPRKQRREARVVVQQGAANRQCCSSAHLCPLRFRQAYCPLAYRPCFLRIAWTRCSASRSLSAARARRPFIGDTFRHFEQARLFVLLKWWHLGHRQSVSWDPPAQLSRFGANQAIIFGYAVRRHNPFLIREVIQDPADPPQAPCLTAFPAAPPSEFPMCSTGLRVRFAIARIVPINRSLTYVDQRSSRLEEPWVIDTDRQ